MTSIIFNFVSHSESSIIASNRIASYVRHRLGYNIVDYRTVADYEGMRLDRLFIVNGAYAFCKCLPELAALIDSARKIIWIQNDYTIIPPKTSGDAQSPFRRAFRENHKKVSYFSTCEKFAGATPLSSYVNWNQLTFDPKYDPAAIRRRRKKATDDLFYYGSYRAEGKPGSDGKNGRERYFDRYFRTPALRTSVSSPAKTFRERFDQVEHLDAIRENFYEKIGVHGMGLYIEDRRSHEEFHSPANRFYEMLSAGLPMVFQPECGTMLRRAGFDPSPYLVASARDVPGMMERREAIGKEQRAAWVRDFRRELDSQFDAAMEKLS